MRENRYVSTREGFLMGRRVLRFRIGFLACAAILVSVVSMSASTSASAAQATPASAAGIPGGFTYQAQVQLINLFNSECLDGREGTGNVTVQTCYTDGTHEVWNLYADGDEYMLVDVFNGLCLDGREGTGNVTVQPCGTDGTHEYWIAYQYTYYSATFENVFNGLYLDGREGTGNVTVQPGPNNDGLHEYWNPA
jgi:Ricin-type beta-trefoil lectin domain